MFVLFSLFIALAAAQGPIPGCPNNTICYWFRYNYSGLNGTFCAGTFTSLVLQQPQPGIPTVGQQSNCGALPNNTSVRCSYTGNPNTFSVIVYHNTVTCSGAPFNTLTQACAQNGNGLCVGNNCGNCGGTGCTFPGTGFMAFDAGYLNVTTTTTTTTTTTIATTTTAPTNLTTTATTTRPSSLATSLATSMASLLLAVVAFL